MIKYQTCVRWVIAIIVMIAILFSGVFAVTISTIMQSYVVLALGVACLISLVLNIRLAEDKKWIFIVSWLSLLYFSTRAYFSPVVDLGRSDLFLILPVASMFYLQCVALNKVIFVRWLLGCITVLFILNMLCFIPLIGELRDGWLPFARGNEQSGMFNHRNFCSNFLMIGTLIWSVFLFSPRISMLKRVAVALLVIAGVVTMIMASARGGILGFGFGFGVLMVWTIFRYWSRQGRMLKVVSGVGVAVCAAAVVMAGSSVIKKRSSAGSGKIEIGDRSAYFAMAVDQIPDAVMLGSGSMSYSYKYYENWGEYGQHYLDHVWVHNEYVQAVTDYGVVGLFFILFLLGMISIYCLKNILGDYHSRSIYTFISDIRVAGFIVMLGFSINMLASFPAHSQPNLLAFVIALNWMLLSSNKSKRSPSRELSGLRSICYGVLVAVGVGAILVSFNEVRAARVFHKYGIYTDSQNWDINDHMRDGWFKALQDVKFIQPSYLRYERLSGLYLERANYADIEENRKNVELALEYSEYSLERHPFYAVALANKAKALWKLERYQEADHAYDRLAKMTKSRQKYFKPYVTWANCLNDWALTSGIKGDQSIILHQRALKTWHNSKMISNQYAFNVLNRIIVSEADALLKAGRYDELGDVLDHYYATNAISGWNDRNPEILSSQALMLRAVSDAFHSKRKPEESYKWLLLSYKYFKGLNQKFPKAGAQYKGHYKYVVKKIQFFKDTKTTPAK